MKIYNILHRYKKKKKKKRVKKKLKYLRYQVGIQMRGRKPSRTHLNTQYIFKKKLITVIYTQLKYLKKKKKKIHIYLTSIVPCKPKISPVYTGKKKKKPNPRYIGHPQETSSTETDPTANNMEAFPSSIFLICSGTILTSNIRPPRGFNPRDTN